MNNWKAVVLVTAAVLLFCGAPVKADDPPVVLTFEGIGDDVAIGNFYNGGAGGSLLQRQGRRSRIRQRDPWFGNSGGHGSDHADTGACNIAPCGSGFDRIDVAAQETGIDQN